MNIASTVPFPGINPNCNLIKSISVHIHFSSTLSTILMACSCSFTLLYDPQLITSSFPLKIGKSTFVFHSSLIPLTSNTCCHSSIITVTPISPLATIISRLTILQMVQLPFLISSFALLPQFHCKSLFSLVLLLHQFPP